MKKRKKIRVKGGMDLREYFVATKESPKSRAMKVRANKGRMPASGKGYVLGESPPPPFTKGGVGGIFLAGSRVKRPVMRNSKEYE
jgi:hypothetical protein